VVSAREALEALHGGADVIDVKNPAEGPLGAPQPRTVGEIMQAVARRKPVSLALGEYPGRPTSAAWAALGAAGFAPAYLKIGFPGWVEKEEIDRTLKLVVQAVAELGGETLPRVVAVGYADTTGRSWRPADLPGLAKEAGAAGCLLDTWDKTGPPLPRVTATAELEAFVGTCRANGLTSGLAGRLGEEEVVELLALCPTVIGIRSAACVGDRVNGCVTAERVGRLKRLLQPS
jgi:uncharacterized protein (UPF0264 family)